MKTIAQYVTLGILTALAFPGVVAGFVFSVLSAGFATGCEVVEDVADFASKATE